MGLSVSILGRRSAGAHRAHESGKADWAARGRHGSDGSYTSGPARSEGPGVPTEVQLRPNTFSGSRVLQRVRCWAGQAPGQAGGRIIEIDGTL
jgi:hypothetical protein